MTITLLLAVLLHCSFASLIPLNLGETVSVTVGKRNWTYFSYDVPGGNNETYKFTVKRETPQGQEVVYIRFGSYPTKVDYDEIDTESTGLHVIQFIPRSGLHYFAILNVFSQDAIFQVTLVTLAGKRATLAFEGQPFAVCEGNVPPLYGPPSISLGLSSFAVACAKRATKSRASIEFRKFNGQLLRSDILRTPRGGLFAEPAVKFIKNTYQAVNSFEYSFFNHINLRSYEQDGTLIQNKTSWGSDYLPETREFWPQIIWNGTTSLVYWHIQYSWFGPYEVGYDLRGQELLRSRSLQEPRSNGNDRPHPSRLRATWNPNVATDVDSEVGVFIWEARRGASELSFCIQKDNKDRCPRSVIPGDSWVNDTHGGIDMTVTSRNEYVLVHPVSSDTIQLTLMGSNSQIRKTLRVKHDSQQPNLLTIDNWVFLTTEFNGIGYLTVLNEELEIILTEPIGSQHGRRMVNPVLSYQPLLDMALVLYTDPDTQQAMVQRLSLTFPE